MKPLLAIGPCPPPWNGLSSAFHLLTEGLAARGWALKIVNLMQGPDHAVLSSAQKMLGATSILQETRRAMADVDLVYLTISQSALGFAKDALILEQARRRGIPSVVHLHGGNFARFYEAQPAPYQWVIRRALGSCRKLIVLGESLRSEFRMVSGWETRTEVVQNPVDVPALGPKTLPRPDEPLRLLFLSNLIVEKGYLDVLEALPGISNALGRRRIEFHAAGSFLPLGSVYRNSATQEEDFRKRSTQIEQAHPNIRIIFHGVARGRAKSSLLRDSHVFLLPTYYRNEGQPIALLEALTSGLPVIATAFRGISELLPESARRLCVPEQSPTAIVSTVARLLQDAELYSRCSREAVTRAADFSADRHLSRMEQTLKSAQTPP